MTNFLIIKKARIIKLPSGKYRVISEKGKNLGTFDSKIKANERLSQVEFFKHKDKNSLQDVKKIDLTKIDDFSYSAIMRSLRKQLNQNQILSFLKIFKMYFDKAIKNNLENSERVALQNTLVKFNTIFPLKLDKAMIKNAAISELGDPILVGKYLADIIRFTLNRISPERRQEALSKLRNKIYSLSEYQIAMKNLPATSAMGQSITFVKHVLFNHNPQYIREVLNNITRNLI